MGYNSGTYISILENVFCPLNSNRDFYSLEFDEVSMEKDVNNTINKYSPSLDLVGIWHTHPSMDPVLSLKDIETSVEYSKLNDNGIISCIINYIDGNTYSCIYYVNSKGLCLHVENDFTLRRNNAYEKNLFTQS